MYKILLKEKKVEREIIRVLTAGLIREKIKIIMIINYGQIFN